MKTEVFLSTETMNKLDKNIKYKSALSFPTEDN